VLSAKVTNRAGVLPYKKVTFDRQGDALSENDVDEERLGGGYYEGGKNVTGVNVPSYSVRCHSRRFVLEGFNRHFASKVQSQDRSLALTAALACLALPSFLSAIPF